MSEMPERGLGMVEENEATGEVNTLYGTIKQEFQVPQISNVIKTIANSPAALQFYVDMLVSFYKNTALPQSLTALIFYAISKKSDSSYFTAVHEMMGRQAGVDEETLKALPNHLDAIESERTRAIIEFALKAARSPQALNAKDYDRIRAFCPDNDEIMQIIFVASIAVYLNVVANALKIEVDPELSDASGQAGTLHRD